MASFFEITGRVNGCVGGFNVGVDAFRSTGLLDANSSTCWLLPSCFRKVSFDFFLILLLVDLGSNLLLVSGGRPSKRLRFAGFFGPVSSYAVSGPRPSCFLFLREVAASAVRPIRRLPTQSLALPYRIF